MTKIIDVRHPDYLYHVPNWEKYRRIKDGGDCFITEYLQKFSGRESDDDFQERKKITYNPAFAKSAVEEIQNAIYQRIAEVHRISDLPVYNKMVVGLNGGVDRKGTSMNSYIGRTILPELVFMSSVGVYVDRPELAGTTLKDNYGNVPYMYKYEVENILSWKINVDDPSDFESVLLREYVDSEELHLVAGRKVRYRHCFISKETGKVHVDFYNEDGELIDKNFNIVPAGYDLELTKIPFVLFNLSQSLLVDAANYQIALLNLASSDMNYAVKANFPFYVEQTDFTRNSMNKLPGEVENPGEATSANAKQEELKLGVTQGRRYGKSLDAPQFIHPSPEPLLASIQKQEQLRNELRSLVHLSLSNVMSKSASAESKGLDNQGLDSGLSCIALELEAGERKIAQHITAYMGGGEVATVHYPLRYNLQTEDERQAEIESIRKQITAIPSKTYQKTMAKELVLKQLGHKVSHETLQKIYEEIDAAPAVISDPDIIIKDVEAGIMSHETASQLRQYPKDEYAKAQKEHADKLAEIAKHQTSPVRGVKETQADNISKDDKKGKQQRGQGKFSKGDKP